MYLGNRGKHEIRTPLLKFGIIIGGCGHTFLESICNFARVAASVEPHDGSIRLLLKARENRIRTWQV